MSESDAVDIVKPGRVSFVPFVVSCPNCGDPHQTVREMTECLLAGDGTATRQRKAEARTSAVASTQEPIGFRVSYGPVAGLRK